MTHKLYPSPGNLYALNEIERALLCTALRCFGEDINGEFSFLIDSMIKRLSTPAGPAYTCKGKGGVYEHIGTAKGAGTSKDALAVVYRDAATGDLYFRTPDDFAARMEKANTP